METPTLIAFLVLIVLGLLLLRRTSRATAGAHAIARDAATAADEALERARVAEEQARGAAAEAAEARQHVEHLTRQAQQRAAAREARQVERDSQAVEQREREAHDERGPHFEVVKVHASRVDHAASIDVRMVGGPGVMDLELAVGDTVGCRGLSTGLVTPSRPPSRSIALARVQPHAVIRFLVVMDPDHQPTPEPLALTVTARSPAETGEQWRRALSIPLSPTSRAA